MTNKTNKPKKEEIDYSDLRPKHPDKKCPAGMRSFTVCRPKDESGISGIGIVVEGVVFATGQCIIHWLSPIPKGSVAIFESIEDFIKIHIKPHPKNKTIITYDDNETIRFDENDER